MALAASAPPVPTLSPTSALAGVGALGAALHVGGSLLIVAGQTIVKVSHCIRETSANPGGWLVRPLVLPAGGGAGRGGGGGGLGLGGIGVGEVDGGAVYPKWRRPDGAWRSHHVGYRLIAALGWFLFAVGNALRFASMRFAAQTVLSGLGSLQFALIPPVSRLLLGVRSGASALLGVLLVLLGNVLILACGPGERDFTLPQLRALWLDGDMRLFLAGTALVLAASHVAWRELKRPGKLTMRLLHGLDRTGWVGAGRRIDKASQGGAARRGGAAGGGGAGGAAGGGGRGLSDSDWGAALGDECARLVPAPALALASASEDALRAAPSTSSAPPSARRSFSPAHRRTASLDGAKAGEGDAKTPLSLLSGKRREGDAGATDGEGASRDPSAGAPSSASSASTLHGGAAAPALQFASSGTSSLALSGSSSLPLPGSGGRRAHRPPSPSSATLPPLDPLRLAPPSSSSSLLDPLRLAPPSSSSSLLDPLRLAPSSSSSLLDPLRLAPPSRPSPAPPLSPSACVSSPTAAPEADPAAVLASAVLFSTVAASIGAWSVLFSKSLTFVVAAAPGSLRDPYSWFVAAAFLATASFWIARSDQGLRLYPALLIMPLMQATWTAASVLQGGVYFEEFQGIPPARTGLLVLGLVVALGGALAMGVDGYRGERDAAVRDEDRRTSAPSIDAYIRVIDLEEGWNGGTAGPGPARRRPTTADPLDGPTLAHTRRGSPGARGSPAQGAGGRGPALAAQGAGGRGPALAAQGAGGRGPALAAPGAGGRGPALAAPGAAKSAAAKGGLKAANGIAQGQGSTSAANAALELAPLLPPDGSAAPEGPGGTGGGPSGLAAVRPLSGAPVRRGASHASGHFRTSSL